MKEIFVIDKKGEIRPLTVSERDWNRGVAFSAKIDGELRMVKQGGPLLEGFYSGFETKEEAEQLIYRHAGHPYS